MNDRIHVENRTKQTPFDRWNKVYRVSKSYNDDSVIKRTGKKINLQQYLNENNRDCTIYQVLDTYRGDLKLTEAKMNTIAHRVADELKGITDLRGALDIMNMAKQSWQGLPLEIRKDFNNDVNNFQKNGLKWANTKIAEWKAKEARQAELIKQSQIQQQQQEQEQTKGNTNG